MELGPVTKIDKRNTATSSCDVTIIFPIYIVNLELSGSRIPDAWSVILIITESVIKGIIFEKKKLIFYNADINKIRGVLELKVIFSETTYVSVLTYQISSF